MSEIVNRDSPGATLEYYTVLHHDRQYFQALHDTAKDFTMKAYYQDRLTVYHVD